jgi:hypothetical protein
MTTEYKMTQEEFEKLPKTEQDFRWALFVESNGHEQLVSKTRIQQLRKQYKLEETA